LNGKLKVLIVTSQTTFVKDNYLKLLGTLTDSAKLPENVSVCGVVLIKNADIKLLAKSIFLFFTGAVYISKVLIKNIFSGIFFDKRTKLMKSKNIPVIGVQDINSSGSIIEIKKLDPDLIINIRTRSIYKKELLAIPKLGCINVHHGILPQQRGTMCDLWALYKNKPVGFTIHRMNEKIDEGEILFKKTVDIRNTRKYIDIPQMSAEIEAEAVLECIGMMSAGVINKEAVNSAVKIRYFRNPSRTTMKKMLESGIKL